MVRTRYRGRYLAGSGLNVRGHENKVDSGRGARVRVVGGEMDDLIEGEEVRDSSNLIEERGREGVVNIEVPK